LTESSLPPTSQTETHPQKPIDQPQTSGPAAKSNAQELLAGFPCIFKAIAESDFSIKLVRCFPETHTSIIEQARMTLRHEVVGSGGSRLHLGSEIDWQRDPQGGRSWQRQQTPGNCICRTSDSSDPRRVWALSRSHHLLPLALASILENRADFADEVEKQIHSWIEQNPVGEGINWSSSAEAALRVINWLHACCIVSSRWPLEREFAEILVEHLTATGRFIRHNMGALCCGLNDYHYLANLVGLLYLGELRRDSDEGQKWLEFALSELETKVGAQFDGDGLLRQSSLSYHGFATELILQTLLLADHCDWDLPASVRERFEGMIDILARYRRPDGKLTPWGDSEELRVSNWLGRDPRDFLDVILIGRRCLTKTSQPEAILLPEELLVFGGQAISGTVPRLRQRDESYLLRESGICRLQSRQWRVDFFADTQPTKPANTHQHNDLLSLVADYNGQSVLIDPGTYSYAAGEQTRRQFRGTAAHNTVMIDGQEQRRSVADLPFVLRPDAEARIGLWQTSETTDQIVCEHNGYRRLADPVLHRRALCLDKSSEVLLLKDELRGEREHEVQSFFHLGEVTVTALDPRNLLLKLPQGETLLLALLSPDQRFEVGVGWHSPAYDLRRPGLVISTTACLKLPCMMLYSMAPCDESCPEKTHELINNAASLLGWL
jgi:hypothetical protein